jgi:hypothetical protein
MMLRRLHWLPVLVAIVYLSAWVAGTAQARSTVTEPGYVLRAFRWNGYDIQITVPGRDHFMPVEFNIPMIYREHTQKGTKYVAEPEVATHLKEEINRGLR